MEGEEGGVGREGGREGDGRRGTCKRGEGGREKEAEGGRRRREGGREGRREMVGGR